MRNLIYILSLLTVSVSLFSCENILGEELNQREYLIEKGNHQSNAPVRRFQGDKLIVDIKFGSCAVYQTQDPGQQSSTNKLIGFSDFGSHHHQNSARFGWKWLNEQLEIYAYCYADGNRLEEFVGVAEIGKFHHYEIHVEDDQYLFFMDELPAVSVTRNTAISSGSRYMLWPYFGGQETAPHDIHIEMTHH